MKDLRDLREYSYILDKSITNSHTNNRRESGNVGIELIDPISSVFDKANKAIEKAIGMFTQNGDILMGHLADMLSIQMKNAQQIFAEERRKLFQELEVGPLREILLRMDEMCELIDQLQTTIFEFEEIVSLDLEQALAGIDVLGNPLYKHRFIMKRIDGTTQKVRQEGAYTLTLVGTNLGTAPSDVRTNVKILAGPDFKKEIPVEQSKVTQHCVTLAIPCEILNQGLNADKPTTIRVMIHVDYKYKHGGIITPWKEYHCQYPITLVIMPAHAGHLSLHVVYPVFQYVRFPDPAIGTYRVTEGAGHSEPYLNVDNSRRLENANLSCDDGGNGGCAFKNESGPYYNPDHTRAWFSVDYWGPPFTETIKADIYQWQHVHDDEANIEKDYNWGELIELTIPTDRWQAANIKGSLITGQEIGFTLEGHDESGSLRVEKITVGTDSTYIQVKVRPLSKR